jgi:hypothetical protein
MRFNLSYRRGGYVVFKAPMFRPKSGAPYDGVASLLKNRRLANAWTALPYYQQDFEIEFKICDGRGKKEILKLLTRQPNGEDDLRAEIMKLAKGAVGNSKSDLMKLEALTMLHPGLAEKFQPWIAKQRRKPGNAESRLDLAARLWIAWTRNPNQDPDVADRISNGERPEVDCFEEILKEIRGPFVGYRVVT